MARTTTDTACPQLTNMNSLANGQAKSLGKIDFETNGAHMATAKVELTLGSSGVSSTGLVNIYFLGSQDDTDWTDGIDPTSTSDVTSSIKNATRIASLNANANSQVVKVVLDLFSLVGDGYSLGALVVANESGAAFAASGHDGDYQTTVIS